MEEISVVNNYKPHVLLKLVTEGDQLPTKYVTTVSPFVTFLLQMLFHFFGFLLLFQMLIFI
jgi:hypothetical protein